MSPTLLSLLVFVGMGLSFVLVAAGRRSVALPPQPSAFREPDVASPVTHALGALSASADPGEIRDERRDLVRAGFRQPYAFGTYLAARTLLALGLPGLALAVGLPSRMSTTLQLVLLLLLAGIGYYGPRSVVTLLRQQRQLRILKVLPDALDMLVSCLEGGIGLDAALKYVGTELTHAAPELSEELGIFSGELRAGLTRVTALARLDDRIGVEQVTALVTMLGQAERYGSGIAESVRDHAQVARRRRLIDAERRAAEALPRLTVIMVLFILPPLFIVLLGPVALHVVLHVIPMLEGR